MNHVVIWGCPRSGTSITFELFSGHPHFRFYFEPGVWLLSEPWYRRQFSEHRHAFKNPFSPAGEQSPGLSCNLEEFLSVVPDADHIWVTRNQFDTVASMLPGMSTHGHPPLLPARWRGMPVVDRSAALWRFWNEVGISTLREAGIEPLHVRYEDLVANTHAAVQRMLSFTSTTWTREVDDYIARVNDTPGVAEADFQRRWHRPHHRHVGRWRDDLSEHDVLTIQNIVGDVPEAWGYDLNPRP